MSEQQENPEVVNIELSLVADSVKDWGYWEAVREFVQNWLDNDQESSYDWDGYELNLHNSNTSLKRSVLLSGSTSKRNDPNSRGCHGDGLKSAISVLLSEDTPFSMRNGNLLWTPVLCYSEKWEEEIIMIEETPSEGASFVASIDMDDEQWEDVRNNVIAFKDIPEEDKIETEKGFILTGEEEKGRIYAGGLYVDTHDDLEYGYDFNVGVLNLDRDRNAVGSFDVKTTTRYMLTEAEREGKLDTESLVKAIEEQSGDTEWLCSYMISDEVSDDLFSSYEENYKGMVLADSAQEAVELQEAGNKAVYLGNSLMTDIIKGNEGYQNVEMSIIQRETPREMLKSFKNDLCNHECFDKLGSEINRVDEIISHM